MNTNVDTVQSHDSLFPGNKLSLGWLLVFVAANTLLIIYFVLSRNMHDNLLSDANQQMYRLQNSLESTLGKHAYLPALLATMPIVREYATDPPADTTEKENFNRQLEQLSNLSNTLAIYLMRPDGETIASSNWNQANSFVGKNFSFRPYFQQAIDGGPGRYFALGTASGERGYYFSHPVRNEDKNTVGVIVVKVDIKAIESAWQTVDVEFLITDMNGVIFMSSRNEWRMKSIYPLSEDSLNEIYRSRKYADSKIQTLQGFTLEPIDKHIAHAAHSGNQYLHLQKDMAEEDWRLHILADRKASRQNLYQTFLLSLIVILLSCLLIYLLIRIQHQRRKYEQQVRQELREKINARTRELKLAQEELVQAAKMAALGELSAGINHELNNPLTAIRAYANNAVQFLENGQLDIVKSNLSEINNLTETMAAIARQLKTFARKSHGNLETIALKHALDSAILIVQPKLTRERVKLIQQIATETLYVKADLLWLEQIIVNLLNNAIEATAGQSEKNIWLEINASTKDVTITVRDNGPGIDETHLPQIFEAFFTTKDLGTGLGLGLSISYRLAKDMQGNLTARNVDNDGAEFTLSLPRVHQNVNIPADTI